MGRRLAIDLSEPSYEVFFILCGGCMERRAFAEVLCQREFFDMAVLSPERIERMKQGKFKLDDPCPPILIVPGSGGTMRENASVLERFASTENVTVVWVLGREELCSADPTTIEAARLVKPQSNFHVLQRVEVNVRGTLIGGCSLLPDPLPEGSSEISDDRRRISTKALFREDCAWLTDVTSRLREEERPYVMVTSGPDYRRSVASGPQSVMERIGDSLRHCGSEASREMSRTTRALARYAHLHVCRDGLFMPQQFVRPAPIAGTRTRGVRVLSGGDKSKADELEIFSIADCLYESALPGAWKKSELPILRRHMLEFCYTIVAADLAMRACGRDYAIECLPMSALACESPFAVGVFVQTCDWDPMLALLEASIHRIVWRMKPRLSGFRFVKIDLIPVRNLADVSEHVGILPTESIRMVQDELGIVDTGRSLDCGIRSKATRRKGQRLLTTSAELV
jgi:hypothetical protein